MENLEITSLFPIEPTKRYRNHAGQIEEVVIAEPHSLPTHASGFYSEWIKCSSILPKNNETVLAYNGNACWLACYQAGIGWTDSSLEYMFDDGEITHWMPLPKFPAS